MFSSISIIQASLYSYTMLFFLNTCTQAEPSTVEQGPVLFCLLQTAGIKHVCETEYAVWLRVFLGQQGVAVHFIDSKGIDTNFYFRDFICRRTNNLDMFCILELKYDHIKNSCRAYQMTQWTWFCFHTSSMLTWTSLESFTVICTAEASLMHDPS